MCKIIENLRLENGSIRAKLTSIEVACINYSGTNKVSDWSHLFRKCEPRTDLLQSLNKVALADEFTLGIMQNDFSFE